MSNLNISRGSVSAHNCSPQKSDHLVSKTKDAQEILKWRKTTEDLLAKTRTLLISSWNISKASTPVDAFHPRTAWKPYEIGGSYQYRCFNYFHLFVPFPYHKIQFFEVMFFYNPYTCHDHINCHENLCQMLNLENFFIIFNTWKRNWCILKIAETHTIHTQQFDPFI